MTSFPDAKPLDMAGGPRSYGVDADGLLPWRKPGGDGGQDAWALFEIPPIAGVPPVALLYLRRDGELFHRFRKGRSP